MKRKIIIGFSIALALISARGPGARAQEVVPDSLITDRFIPIWTSFMRSGVTDVSLGSQVQAHIMPPGGWDIISSIAVQAKSYRSRDMQEIFEQIMNVATKTAPGFYKLDFSIGETYSKKQTMGLARFGKEIIFENEYARGAAILSRPILRASSTQFFMSGGAKRGQNDFKYDKTISGGAGATITYLFGEVLSVKGGGGLMRKRETSEIGTISFDRMPSDADTVSVGARYGRGPNKLLEVEYAKISGVTRWVTPPRGNSLEIIDNPGAAKEEESRLNTETLLVGSSVQLLPFLFINVDFDHKLTSQRNKVDTRLSKEMESTNLIASTDYNYSERGKIHFDVRIGDKSVDYGPNSVSSFSENEKKIVMRASQKITDSLAVSLSGSASLKQKFFKKRAANPRDADYLYYALGGSVRAAPLPRIQVEINGNMSINETINIDRSLSGDNRKSYLYWLSPKIGIRPAQWLDLSQKYSVKIEYTDFVYKDDENYLNRTTSMITEAKFIVMRPLLFKFRHIYMMKDSGSYLLRDDKRKYNRSGENFEQGLFLTARYRPSLDLSFLAEVDFRTQESNRLGFVGGDKVVVSSKFYESGGMKLGIKRERQFWGNGRLDIDINYVRRFGPYISPERREYCEIDSSIAFNF
ncbi:MAG: hypothetical protein KAX13_06815 [Candidatus Krumholzibacteria bacterium]|nr:hypothetical protein [Candidatus Krumholzibacteria bacterium]